MTQRTLDTWWSVTARCWRIEDGRMYTFYLLADVIDHLRRREATALLSPPPHNTKTAELEQALKEAGIPTA